MKNEKTDIRQYRPSDCKEITELFYGTVHRVNSADYTKEQLDVWAPEQADLEKWNRSLLEHYSIVAVEGGKITGFGDIDETGYLDRLYVHADCQRKRDCNCNLRSAGRDDFRKYHHPRFHNGAPVF